MFNKLNPEYLVVAALIAYTAFFTHPPPYFVSQVLSNPVGQVIVLVGIVLSATKSPLVALFLGIAFLVSSNPALEHMENKKEEKPQPKSGAPKPDMAQIGKLASMLAGKSGMMKPEQGKSVKAPPPATAAVKPHVEAKVTEKFSPF
jgi:hypothetical protein